jgi:glycosyltransferase involved in cell wall biosynthesis
MTARPIVMYLGGFARVGGIEAFARDFLLAIAEAYPSRELVMWGKRDRDNLLLNDIAASGAKISSSPWRWGCLWKVPDFVLAPIGLNAVKDASAVIFKRPPPRIVRYWLKWISRQSGRSVPFILVTPYRPKEYWGPSPDLSHLEDFDVITVQSEEGTLDLQEAGYRGRIENIPYLPPEVSELVAYPSLRDDGVIRLGFLGRLVAQKNLGYLLEIFRMLAKDPNRRYELHLFGDGAEREALRQAAADLPGVFFHGETPRAEIARAIDSCDLFLITSLTEGQCLVALEVLSRGRPLVATPVGALPEVLRQPELGRLASLDNAPAFAATVAEVANGIRSGAVTPASVATAFRTRYDYHAIRQRYLDLLADLGVRG